MAHEPMTNDENYCFDVGGYLILRGALDDVALTTLNMTLDRVNRFDGMLARDGTDCEPFRDLLVHPVLVNYLNQICGTGFRLEQLPRLLADDPASAVAFDSPLSGGDEPRDQARAYFHQNERRQCQLVRAIWALADVNDGDGGLVFVQASHKTNVAAPAGVLDGTQDLGLVRQISLQAGDLLLLADTRSMASARGRAADQCACSITVLPRAASFSKPAAVPIMRRWMNLRGGRN